MAKEIKYEIEDIIDVLNAKDTHDWGKAIAKISWNNNPATIDIRTMNLSNNFVGKGISLKDEEVDTLVEILVNKGYGNINELEKSINERKKKYMLLDTKDEDIIENIKYVLKVDL